MIQWDEKNQVLTDYMGYPLSRAEAEEFRAALRRHMRKSPADLAAIANKKLKVDMPHYPPYPPEKFE